MDSASQHAEGDRGEENSALEADTPRPPHSQVPRRPFGVLYAAEGPAGESSAQATVAPRPRSPPQFRVPDLPLSVQHAAGGQTSVQAAGPSRPRPEFKPPRKPLSVRAERDPHPTLGPVFELDPPRVVRKTLADMAIYEGTEQNRLIQPRGPLDPTLAGYIKRISRTLDFRAPGPDGLRTPSWKRDVEAACSDDDENEVDDSLDVYKSDDDDHSTTGSASDDGAELAAQYMHDLDLNSEEGRARASTGRLHNAENVYWNGSSNRTGVSVPVFYSPGSPVQRDENDDDDANPHYPGFTIGGLDSDAYEHDVQQDRYLGVSVGQFHRVENDHDGANPHYPGFVIATSDEDEYDSPQARYSDVSIEQFEGDEEDADVADPHYPGFSIATSDEDEDEHESPQARYSDLSVDSEHFQGNEDENNIVDLHYPGFPIATSESSESYEGEDEHESPQARYSDVFIEQFQDENDVVDHYYSESHEDEDDHESPQARYPLARVGRFQGRENDGMWAHYLGGLNGSETENESESGGESEATENRYTSVFAIRSSGDDQYTSESESDVTEDDYPETVPASSDPMLYDISDTEVSSGFDSDASQETEESDGIVTDHEAGFQSLYLVQYADDSLPAQSPSSLRRRLQDVFGDDGDDDGDDRTPKRRRVDANLAVDDEDVEFLDPFWNLSREFVESTVRLGLPAYGGPAAAVAAVATVSLYDLGAVALARRLVGSLRPVSELWA
ncbi:hypothetical protein EXIGLDRAFT_705549 [Exidia glandulosa HHB12029]|uniref:Uncharacterized protein n=1 Tax=Exidia glandulosa HHB12029 TaxID=1314781 RepID=A0A165BCL5_EXIGL|nr:hypothetical protein EXIGLDRAFT_705549 [Exidia glandulosa HHB12029]